MIAMENNQQAHFSKGDFFGGVVLTSAWLLLWQLICAVLPNDSAGSFPAIQRAIELLTSREIWCDINISLFEVGGGLIFGGLFAFAISTVMNSSEKIERAIAKALPSAHLAPIALWPIIFFCVLPNGSSTNWYRSFFSMGIGGKIILVGFLTFFAFIQTLWALREVNLSQRMLIAIHDALPIAFVAMLFGELFGATAGLGFEMIVASATYQYQQGLGSFLITVLLLVTISTILRSLVRLLGWQAAQTQAI